jgi:hypothetical protein
LVVDITDDILELTVLSHPVTVKFCEPEDMHELLGLCDRNTLEIRVCKGQSYTMTLATLLHELVHVGETILGYRFTEEQVDAVAATFYSVFWDNQPMVDMFNPPQEEDSEE